MSVKSLILTLNAPGTNYGTAQRVLSLQNALQHLGETKLAILKNDQAPVKGIDFIVPYYVDAGATKIHWWYYTFTMAMYRSNKHSAQRLLDIRAEFNFDVVVCSFFESASAAPFNLVPCILDVDRFPNPGGYIRQLLWPIELMMIQRCARRFSSLITVRPDDKAKLPNCVVEWIPVVSQTAKPIIHVFKSYSTILFVGDPSFAPNREAIEYIINVLNHKLINSGRKYSIRLVGAGTEVYKGIPNVQGMGWVEDLREEYASAGIVVCPVWYNEGANLKLAEALQLGCAVVASAESSAAFSELFISGIDLVSATRMEFPCKVIELLDDTSKIDALRLSAARKAQVMTQEFVDQKVAKVVGSCLS